MQNDAVRQESALYLNGTLPAGWGADQSDPFHVTSLPSSSLARQNELAAHETDGTVERLRSTTGNSMGVDFDHLTPFHVTAKVQNSPGPLGLGVPRCSPTATQNDTEGHETEARPGAILLGTDHEVPSHTRTLPALSTAMQSAVVAQEIDARPDPPPFLSMTRAADQLACRPVLSPARESPWDPTTASTSPTTRAALAASAARTLRRDEITVLPRPWDNPSGWWRPG